jgi:hypothetical protein
MSDRVVGALDTQAARVRLDCEGCGRGIVARVHGPVARVRCRDCRTVTFTAAVDYRRDVCPWVLDADREDVVRFDGEVDHD